MVGEPRLQWAGVERPVAIGVPAIPDFLRAEQLKRARLAVEREERKRNGVKGKGRSKRIRRRK